MSFTFLLFVRKTLLPLRYECQKVFCPLIMIHELLCCKQLTQFYHHSESADFPRKIATSSCRCGSLTQNAFSASRNAYLAFDPCIQNKKNGKTTTLSCRPPLDTTYYSFLIGNCQSISEISVNSSQKAY